jgi:large repetitive protein
VRSKRYSLALMPYWVLAIAMGMASQAASAARCDVDADRDIDRSDIVSIRQAVGSPASGGNDPRDGDGDGHILRNDELLCALRCTLPLCELVSGDGHANRRPLARHDSARTAENTSVRINVIANDRDPDGRLVAKSIKIVTRPKHGRVRNHRNGIVTYTPASGFTGQDQFRYRVRDDDHARSRAVRVRIIVERGNHPPLADAGSDTNTTTALPVTLNGSGSSDPDGDALTFLWRFLSVPPASTVTDASLANGNTAAPRFTPDVDGPYELALEASDGARSDVDTVIVTARAANVPPNANAGPDASAVTGQAVNLDGRGSADPDNGPAPLRFRWSFAAVPPGSLLSDIDIAGASTALASFTPDFAGDYRISLDVNDGADTGRDEVLIAAALPNVAPNANAGTDLVVQLGAGATLDGAASNDPDSGPTPLSFQWTFVNVPVDSLLTEADLSGATTAAPSFTPDVEGFYLLRLDVSDGDLMDVDQVQVKANVAPVAVDDAFTVDEDTSLNEPAPGVLGNDSDGTSDPLTAVLNTDVSHGTLTLNPNGSFTYTPDTDFQGTDSFTYRANDGTVNSTNLALVTITVAAVDDPPVAVDDVATVNEEALATTIAVLANDTDVDGGAKTILAVQNPSANGGTVLITNGGADLTYQPAADYCNAPPSTTPDTFTYTLSPGSSIATVSVTVNRVNDAPDIANLAGDILGYTQGDPATPIDQLGDAAATDVDSPDFDTGTLTVSLPAGLVAAEDEIGIRNQGTAANQIGVTGTDVTFNPGSGAVIIGSFSGGGAGGGNLVVTFNASAGAAAVSALLQNITYRNSNTTAPTPANRTVRFVLSDGDGGTSLGSDATITIALNTPPELTAGGASPTFTEDGAPIVLDGALTVADANDTNLESATVRITAGFQTGQDVLGFVDTPSITGSFQPLTGILTLTGSATLADYQTALRSVTYQNTSQNPNTAARSVAFVANDGSANSNTITTTVTVQSVNDTPSFSASNPPTILEDAGAQTVVSWATFNPGPPDESGQAVVGYTVSNISNGALFSVAPVVAANGTLTYIPAANVNGVSTFDVVVQDDGGTANGGIDTSAPQTFTITVNDINDPPAFTAGANQTVNEDAGPQTVSPWATAIDDGDDPPGITQTLTFNVTGNTNPSLFSAGPSISPTGVLTYTPAANASGTATITLNLLDDGGTANGGDDTSDPQSFTITVNATNDAPTFIAGANQAVDEDSGAQSVSGWATAIDDGDPESTQTLTFNITGNTNPSLFSAGPTVSPTGTLTYTPAANAFGSANITLVLQDDGGTTSGGDDTSDPQTFTITINAVNDAPSFTAGSNPNVPEDAGPQTVNPWATAISPGPANESGQTVSFNITSNTNPGLFSAGPNVSPAGVLTFTPLANANGSASIQLVIQDNGGTGNGGDDTSDAQGFSITITAVNDPPSVTPPAAYPAHAHIAINIPDGATDLFNGSTITDVDGPGAAPFAITAAGPFASTNGGSVTILGDGSFSYNPPAGFTGTNDTFLYQICDSGVPGSACTNATATVAVSGPRVWFVNNALGSSGDGRLSSPFNSLTAADTAANASGDRIFVFTGAGTYTLGFGFLTNQRLIGQGVVDTNFDIALGITPPATSVARPSINATRPIINGTITLATGGTARGFNVSNTTANGVTGSSATSLIVNQISVTTTTGRAVNLLNSGGTISFDSVSSNGAANGILLNNTTGSFTVTGGTIQNSTDSGINGTSVNGLSLSGLSVTNNGNGVTDDDEGIKLVNLLGTASITNTSVTGSSHHNFLLDNSSGTLASLTITGSTFNSAVGGNGILFRAIGTAAVTSVSVTGSTFSDNQVTGMHVISEDTATVSDFTVSGNTFTDANAADGRSQEIGMDFNTNDTGNLTFKVLNNLTITGHNSHAMNIATGVDVAGSTVGSSLNGRLEGNVIGNASVAGSGSKIGNGIRVSINGGADTNLLFDTNTLRQCPNGRGMDIVGRNGAGGLDVTVTNNNVNPQDVSGFPLPAIVVHSNCVGVCNTVRSDVRGNTVPAGVSTDLLPTHIALVETSGAPSPPGTSTLQLVDTAPASLTCTDQLISTNTGSASANAGCGLIAGPINTPP